MNNIKETPATVSDMEKMINEYTSSLIIELIKKRKELKITQRELAKMSGVKQSCISRLERQHIIPQIDTVQRLAIVLGLKLTFISI